jgi:hypothetical protein
MKLLKLYSVLTEMPEAEAIAALAKWIPAEAVEAAFTDANKLMIVEKKG